MVLKNLLFCLSFYLFLNCWSLSWFSLNEFRSLCLCCCCFNLCCCILLDLLAVVVVLIRPNWFCSQFTIFKLDPLFFWSFSKLHNLGMAPVHFTFDWIVYTRSYSRYTDTKPHILPNCNCYFRSHHHIETIIIKLALEKQKVFIFISNGYQLYHQWPNIKLSTPGGSHQT